MFCYLFRLIFNLPAKITLGLTGLAGLTNTEVKAVRVRKDV